nr:hypothetical protein GCM10020093_081940 [Planobispora longispora]
MGLTLAERTLGQVRGRRALVVGAGSMSALSAATLQRAGVSDIVVVNRTHERAVRLAQTVGGRAAPSPTWPRSWRRPTWSSPAPAPPTWSSRRTW